MASNSVVFFIPSVHDGKMLECRLQFPPMELRFNHQEVHVRHRKGVVLAHPYAPLGGCFDDPIVESAATEFLCKGFIVGTFNFRGAGASEGRTSWTAKAEIDDYVSFVGFFIQYIHESSLAQSVSVGQHNEEYPGSSLGLPGPDRSSVTPSGNNNDQAIILVLGGYSYGSMIATLLPTMSTTIMRFTNPSTGSIEAKIRACVRRIVLRESADSVRTIHGHSEGLDTRRGGTEQRIRRSLDRVRTIVSRKSADQGNRPSDQVASCEQTGMPDVETFYLLISPLLPPVSSLATLFTRTQYLNVEKVASDSNSENLVARRTLAIYGDCDMFTSVKKLRRWTSILAERPASNFQFSEIAGAGHFWNEDGVEQLLKTAVKDWLAQTVLKPAPEGLSPAESAEHKTSCIGE